MLDVQEALALVSKVTGLTDCKIKAILPKPKIINNRYVYFKSDINMFLHFYLYDKY